MDDHKTFLFFSFAVVVFFVLFSALFYHNLFALSQFRMLSVRLCLCLCLTLFALLLSSVWPFSWFPFDTLLCDGDAIVFMTPLSSTHINTHPYTHIYPHSHAYTYIHKHEAQLYLQRPFCLSCYSQQNVCDEFCSGRLCSCQSC